MIPIASQVVVEVAAIGLCHALFLGSLASISQSAAVVSVMKLVANCAGTVVRTILPMWMRRRLLVVVASPQTLVRQMFGVGRRPLSTLVSKTKRVPRQTKRLLSKAIKGLRAGWKHRSRISIASEYTYYLDEYSFPKQGESSSDKASDSNVDEDDGPILR